MATGERTDVDRDEGSRADHIGAIRYNIEAKGKADVSVGLVSFGCARGSIERGEHPGPVSRPVR